MADLLTPYAGLTKPTVGADNNTWGGLLNTDLDLIDQFLRKIVPPGVSWAFRGAALPAGFLWEDGSVVSRATYAALFAAIGTTYGVGDGSTTFNLPDSRGRFTIGVGTGIGLGQIGGSYNFTAATDPHALILAEMPTHSHAITDVAHGHALHDPSHVHALHDPAHNHALHDPSHQHALSSVVDNFGPFVPNHGFGSVSGSLQIANDPTQPGVTGLWLDPALTGMWMDGQYTGQTLDAAVSGINGTQANGGGAGHTHTLTNIATTPPYLAANRIIKT